MNIEQFREHCLSYKSVTESFPFDNVILVFKVEGKMFAAANVDDFTYFNVKCDPDRAQELRAEFMEVTPGYHMNKKHWNSVSVQGTLSNLELQQHVAHSYELVVKSLPKKLRESLQ